MQPTKIECFFCGKFVFDYLISKIKFGEIRRNGCWSCAGYDAKGYIYDKDFGNWKRDRSEKPKVKRVSFSLSAQERKNITKNEGRIFFNPAVSRKKK